MNLMTKAVACLDLLGSRAQLEEDLILRHLPSGCQVPENQRGSFPAGQLPRFCRL